MRMAAAGHSLCMTVLLVGVYARRVRPCSCALRRGGPAGPRAGPRTKPRSRTACWWVTRWLRARLRHQRLFSLNELNRSLRTRLADLNQRPFKKLPGCRVSDFAEMGQPALRPLPQTDHEYAEWEVARVGVDYHVEVDGHYYSVPCQRAGTGQGAHDAHHGRGVPTGPAHRQSRPVRL